MKGNQLQQLTSQQAVDGLETIVDSVKHPKTRLKEPSTWASFTGLCSLIVAVFPATAAVVGPLGLVCGAAGYWLREKPAN